MPGNVRGQVFISYSRRDRERADTFQQALESDGISTWKDRDSLLAGSLWPAEIGEAIAQCRLLLLNWTESASKSHFVKFEWATAIALQIPVVPCLLDDTRLHPSLAASNGIPDPTESKVTAAIRRALEAQQTATQALAARSLKSADRVRESVLREARYLAEMVSRGQSPEDEIADRMLQFANQQSWTISGGISNQSGVLNLGTQDRSTVRGDSHRAGRDQTVIEQQTVVNRSEEETFPERLECRLIQRTQEGEEAVAGVPVRMGAGLNSVTDEDGFFSFDLNRSSPSDYRPGARVNLLLRNAELKIFRPLDGRVVLPASVNDLQVVEVVPKGSPLLLTHDQVAGIIEAAAGRSTTQTRTQDEDPEKDDFASALESWAKEYGFRADEVQKAVEDWVREVEQTKNDERELALAAFARREYAEAAKRFEACADESFKELEALEATQRELLGRWIQDKTLQGDALFQQEEYQAALDCYSAALDQIDEAEASEKSGILWIKIGNVHLDLAKRAQDASIHQQFESSHRANKKALEHFSKDQTSKAWAGTYNNLGNALREQGIRVRGEAGAALLGEAVDSYRRALEVYTREDLPQDWAMTHNNLGLALQEQGIRVGGEVGKAPLEEAIRAYRCALEVYTREHLSYYHDLVQRNLRKAKDALEQTED